MATEPRLPLVIPKRKTVKLGEGATLDKDTFSFHVDLEKQSLADVRGWMQHLVISDTAQQMSMGNPPQVTTVDDKTDKKLKDINRKATVIFGTVLVKEAMLMIVRELQRAIARAGMIDTGTLINMQNWQWVFIRRGKSPQNISSGAELPSFTQGDMLVLSPDHVPHASWANMLAKRADGSKGFMAQATAAVRKLPVFKQFSVRAVFTSAHSVAGERYPHGTPIIVVRPRIRRSR